MSLPVVLSTKLFFPPARHNIVTRPRLLEKVTLGLQSQLLLISAPAGYGKTSLMSEWRSGPGSEMPTAWLSLDKDDNDVTLFLIYLATALGTLVAGIGETGLAYLQSPLPPPQVILTALINDLVSVVSTPFVLVLDDYHLIISQLVHEAVTFLLDHLPPQMHLVILTRADPILPLSNLRVHNQMTELRAADLRFTFEEATLFLNQVMGLALSKSQVEALEERTEGWVAGLQLAALSMQGQNDIQGFISAFTGSHRYIVDYLAEEVLNRQPKHLQDFLVKTSILDQLCAPLCDAITGDSTSETLLGELERANLFLIPLDADRRWFRYHHLFLDVLRSRLLSSLPNQIGELHARASAWLEQNGFPNQAVEHALSGGALELAAKLVGTIWTNFKNRPALQMLGYTTLERWLEAFPPEFINDRPELGMIKVRLYWSLGKVDKMEPCFQAIEKKLDQRMTEGVGQTELANIASSRVDVYVMRTMALSARGEYHAAADLARRALEMAPEENYSIRSTAYLSLYQAHRELGYLDEAADACRQALSIAQKIRLLSVVLDSFIGLGAICQAQAKLHQAEALYTNALRYAEENRCSWISHVALIYIELANVYFSCHRLEESRVCFEKGLELCNQWNHYVIRIYGRFYLSRQQFLCGEEKTALETMRDVNRLAIQSGIHTNENYIKAQLAWMEAKAGDPAWALAWLEEQNIHIGERLGITECACALLTARVMLALGKDSTALSLLTPIEKAARRVSANAWRIEALMLKATAFQKMGKSDNALRVIEKALHLAEMEDCPGIILNEGKSLINFLPYVAAHGVYPAYIKKLLSYAISADKKETAAQLLVEPLSERELEILHLVAEGLSNGQIAERLIIANGTVKKHINNIFGKLGVQRRTECVARARELNLL